MTDKGKQKSMNQWGPSDTVRSDGVEVKALTKEMIQEIVAAYGHVAELVKRAGFEMLMVHGGHGWLINQFLSPYFNKRTDEYGGNLENRCRFAIEVLKAVREAVGPFFPIEFRLSGSELFEGGYDLEEGCRIAEQIEPYIDLLHVSAGTYQRGFGDTHSSMFKEHGCNVYLAAEIKKHVSVPVATIGGLNDPAQMEEIIASGSWKVDEGSQSEDESSCFAEESPEHPCIIRTDKGVYARLAELLWHCKHEELDWRPEFMVIPPNPNVYLEAMETAKDESEKSGSVRNTRILCVHGREY